MGLLAGWWVPYAVMGVLLTLVARAGIVATDIGPWYRGLDKPPWQPPDWLFGPAWTTIYVCIAIATGRLWNDMPETGHAAFATLVGANLALNALWSFLFFKWRRPAWALVEVVPLWLTCLGLVLFAWPFDALAAWLYAPYLVWVTFAARLNLEICRLNPRAHERVGA